MRDSEGGGHAVGVGNGQPVAHRAANAEGLGDLDHSVDNVLAGQGFCEVQVTGVFNVVGVARSGRRRASAARYRQL